MADKLPLVEPRSTSIFRQILCGDSDSEFSFNKPIHVRVRERSLKVIEICTVYSLWYGFLSVFCTNFGSSTYLL